jgi:hypothetical protein
MDSGGERRKSGSSHQAARISAPVNRLKMLLAKRITISRIEPFPFGFRLIYSVSGPFEGYGAVPAAVLHQLRLVPGDTIKVKIKGEEFGGSVVWVEKNGVKIHMEHG